MFSSLSPIPADPLFGLQKDFETSTLPHKINLGIGIYFDDAGRPFVMPSVQRVGQELDHTNNNYVSMRGDANLLDTWAQMIFGSATMASAQVVGGTHGIWTMGKLFRRAVSAPHVLVGVPTWANHFALLEGATFTRFPHTVWNNNRLVFAHHEYLNAMQSAPENSVLLLHGGKTHNPTGMNASLEQLEEIIALANKKNIFLLVDYAYFGMGEGWDIDVQYAKIFSEKADRCAIIFSFSKNATLYKHRLGMLYVKDETTPRSRINEHLENIVRESISNPPAFGAMVMDRIFTHYLENWKEDLETMRQSIDSRRNALFEKVGNQFPHLEDSRGMFTLMGFDVSTVQSLKEQGIFMPDSSRINFGGLFPDQIKTLAKVFEVTI